MIGFDAGNANQSVAAFLVSRPPYAWIGFGWESDDRNWNDLFYLQVRWWRRGCEGVGVGLHRSSHCSSCSQAGEPTGLCAEGPTGVFSRPWTLGTASLDCNTWTASLPFSPL